MERDIEISMPVDDREFNQIIAQDRMSLGMFSEMICAADCFARGYNVSRPLSGISKYDLIADTGSKLARLQVKTMSHGGQAYVGYLKYTQPTYGKRGTEVVIPKYDGTEFDFLVAVDRKTHLCYYVPVEEIDFKKQSFPIGKKIRDRYLEF